ncbi:5-formyltetrahydrofolate cyclo-ligase [Falsirhodobacter halotolerans]|uniref:5-formyltetrahydrofolate cyclo-ligase n=1 Tax=Falsirhodobacter halotolerans TaxID=1146892 RepID=UPI001FD04AF5|nr:5-formyltetrahydrofolate cyclo-ligase [Falsirhodobacter halotolerans]MCJ8140644.1 5-formyltetrahydrofolate cyclo-ligase [Falsirhodobacter halotolerans]
MQQPRLIRQRIWDRLRPVARPDARFHLDFDQFVPDFDGSDAATDRVALPDGLVFVTPDNAMLTLRARLIAQRRRFVIASYNLRRGFLLVDPAFMPALAPDDLATLDVMERHARPLDLAALSALGPIGLVATGASAVSMDGVRFGRGHTFLDLEWGIFAHLGMVGDGTKIVAITHDVQLADDLLNVTDHELPVDLIATPTRLVRVPRKGRRPRGVRWNDVGPDLIATIPPLAELARERGIA